MILQSLYEYYQRKASEPDSKIAPEGWEWKEIPFLAVIDSDGNFLRFEDTREGRRGKSYCVPSLGEKKGNGIKANLLWENLEYMFGTPVPRKNKTNPNLKRVKEQRESFVARIESLKVDSYIAKTLQSFIKKDHSVEVQKDPIWNSVVTLNQSILIAVDKVGKSVPVTEIEDVRNAVNSLCGESGAQGTCLILGEKSEVERLEAPIKGVRGLDIKAERALVSFNHPAFLSYGKDKNYNSPVSKKAAFAYTTALNTLLSKDSQNKLSVADSTIVFWAQKKSDSDYDLESDFAWYLKNDKDDPDRGVKAVQGLYNAIQSGRLPPDEGNRFFVLGLAPNAARISVRLWKTGAIKEFAEKIKQHFDDFQIDHGPKEPDHLSLYQILSSTALGYKMDNVPPNLAGKVVESVLDGSPYPTTLLHQCVRRIRAERTVNRARAAILKAYINRFNRFHNIQEREVLMSLDRNNKNVGYRLGRLFAVLEKIQEEANQGINATIRDRFYGAVSATPMTVFPQLLKLKNHHLAKLKPGRKVNFEKEIGEIFEEIMDDVPAHMSLNEQAQFAVGYYHQRQDFFKKKNENKQSE